MTFNLRSLLYYFVTVMMSCLDAPPQDLGCHRKHGSAIKSRQIVMFNNHGDFCRFLPSLPRRAVELLLLI